MPHNPLSIALGRLVQCMLYHLGFKRSAVKCRRAVDHAERNMYWIMDDSFKFNEHRQAVDPLKDPLWTEIRTDIEKAAVDWATRPDNDMVDEDLRGQFIRVMAYVIESTNILHKSPRAHPSPVSDTTELVRAIDEVMKELDYAYRNAIDGKMEPVKMFILAAASKLRATKKSTNPAGVKPRWDAQEDEDGILSCPCWVTGCCGVGPLTNKEHSAYCCRCGQKQDYTGIDLDHPPVTN